MDENQAGGAVRQAVGRAQGAAGEFLGDTRTRVEGAARDVAGRAQEDYGDARHVDRSADA